MSKYAFIAKRVAAQVKERDSKPSPSVEALPVVNLRDYSEARSFPYGIGDAVMTPKGEGVVWGVTVHEVLVDTGVVVLGFEFDEIR